MVKRKGILSGFMVFTLVLCSVFSIAQSLLERRVSFNASHQRLDDVLSIISNNAGFSFSYNSNILKRDSLVSLSVSNKTVRQVLNQLFNGSYEYKESGNYIILRRVGLQLTTVTKTAPAKDNTYTISGYVVNSETGERISDVSIYETGHLTSTLTDANGNFSIKLKDKYRTASLAVSKDAFEDTTVNIPQEFDLQLVIAIVPIVSEVVVSSPNSFELADRAGGEIIADTGSAFNKTVTDEVEKTQMGKFLISASQKIRSLNMKKFFTQKPFQFSVIPGVGTQGKLSGQVVNNFSFNLFGGYTAGINGFELGGLFNLNKKDVRYVQAGGLFNIVGGSVTGLQIGGLQNTSLQNVTGLQVAGINNYVRGNVSGSQIAGVANLSSGEMKGLQLCGVFNYAKKLKGVQVGLINIADTSDGYSIGLINIVLKGYHKVSLSTNESVNANVAFKTGSRRLYSILQAGMNAGKDEEKLYTFGYGLGTEIGLANWISVNPELSSQYLYLGTWDYLNLLNKLHLQFNIKFGKGFSLFGGPSFAVYYSDQPAAVTGYKYNILPSGYRSFELGDPKVRGWFGWNAGINIF